MRSAKCYPVLFSKPSHVPFLPLCPSCCYLLLHTTLFALIVESTWHHQWAFLKKGPFVIGAKLGLAGSMVSGLSRAWMSRVFETHYFLLFCTASVLHRALTSSLYPSLTLPCFLLPLLVVSGCTVLVYKDLLSVSKTASWVSCLDCFLSSFRRGELRRTWVPENSYSISIQSRFKDSDYQDKSMPDAPKPKPNYIFCQYLYPELAHNGGRRTCHDIQAVYK
jgi:hypothetical protein